MAVGAVGRKPRCPGQDGMGHSAFWLSRATPRPGHAGPSGVGDRRHTGGPQHHGPSPQSASVNLLPAEGPAFAECTALKLRAAGRWIWRGVSSHWYLSQGKGQGCSPEAWVLRLPVCAALVCHFDPWGEQGEWTAGGLWGRPLRFWVTIPAAEDFLKGHLGQSRDELSRAHGDNQLSILCPQPFLSVEGGGRGVRTLEPMLRGLLSDRAWHGVVLWRSASSLSRDFSAHAGG